MKRFGLTEEQEMALAIVENLLDDLGLSGEKYSLIESIDEEIQMRNAEEEAEIFGLEDDDMYIGMSAEEFISGLFEI